MERQNFVLDLNASLQEQIMALEERPRALVVEDERAIARLVGLTLERLDFEVEIAPDGLDALERIHRRAPDLILLDVMLPYVDGFDILRRVRALYGDSVRVIMLTSKSEDADVFNGYRAGADAYLNKPFNPLELTTFVRRVMG